MAAPLHQEEADRAGLSNEVKEKLIKGKPKTLKTASLIEGVTPASISILRIFIKKHQSEKVVAKL